MKFADNAEARKEKTELQGSGPALRPSRPHLPAGSEKFLWQMT